MAMLNNQRVYTAKIGVRTNSFIAISYIYVYHDIPRYTPFS